MDEHDKSLGLVLLGAAGAVGAAAAAAWFVRRHPKQAKKAKRFARHVARELTKQQRRVAPGQTTVDDAEWFEVVKEVEAKVVNE